MSGLFKQTIRRIMRIHVIAILGCLLAGVMPTFSQEKRLEIKGDYLGETSDEYMLNHPNAKCGWHNKEELPQPPQPGYVYTLRCQPDAAIAGLPVIQNESFADFSLEAVKMGDQTFHKTRLVFIKYLISGMEPMVTLDNLLTKKFGPPSRNTSNVFAPEVWNSEYTLWKTETWRSQMTLGWCGPKDTSPDKDPSKFSTCLYLSVGTKDGI